MMTTATIDDLLKWMQSLDGTEVRGRKVLDVDLDLAPDGSARVVLTVGLGKTILDRLNGPDDTDEFVWHIPDLRTVLVTEPVWEYWDEFAVRDQRGEA